MPYPAKALSPSAQTFCNDVTQGLRAPSKSLPCKYFYDARGSRLFDAICKLDEYYLTRTELAIMEQSADEMGTAIGPGVMLVEFGSGSSFKTRLLLDHLESPVAYVPIDISRDHLFQSAADLGADYPQIETLPVCADFTREFQLPRPRRTPTHVAVYFPGSTIGNFSPAQAEALLARFRPLCGTGGGLLIGIDLQKDPAIIEAAYNDRMGITAEFNKNLLLRINRELGGNFDLTQFRHLASYDAEKGRVEIHLESIRPQRVSIQGEWFSFQAGERIHTEYSHKYTLDGFAASAERAGLSLERSWTDPDHYFAVLHLTVIDAA